MVIQTVTNEEKKKSQEVCVYVRVHAYIRLASTTKKYNGT